MSEQAVYGKSYWEIVTHAFRKHRAARVALWVSVLMVAVAILAPLLANDRPYYFVGTMPGEYRNAYSAVTRGAFLNLLTMPDRLRAETQKFEKREASLNDYLSRVTDAENAVQFDFINRLRKRAESRPETRGRWIARDVTIAEIEAELGEEQRETPGRIEKLKAELAGSEITQEQRDKKAVLLAELEGVLLSIPEELRMLDASRQRIMRDLPAAYGEVLARGLNGFARNLDGMSDQLDPAMTERARAHERKFRELTAGDYLTTAEDRKPALRAAIEEVKTEFAPARVTLRPGRRWPVLAALNALDVFFIALLLCAMVAFGPLTWWWRLKEIAPIERRWLVTWMLVLAPSVLVALVWLAAHKDRFETAAYKKGVQDGSVVMESALWPPIRYRYDEVPDEATERLRAPDWHHLFGTDFMGRDLLSRMIWGGRISLSIGFVSAAIAVSIGVVLGALAGFYRRWVDIVILRFIEIVICFPTFFLILAVVAFLPPSIYYVMLVLGLFGWMGIARLQRGEFLRLVNQDFVQAAVALGAEQHRVIFRHILPNALAPVLVAASFSIASAMLTESGLSFLGFGVQEPETSWGQILFTGRGHLDCWWTFFIPGFAIFVAVTCYNLVGDGIRDAVDPRLKT